MASLFMMEKYGTDPFRFTLTALTAQGRDICLSEKRIEGYRHFANKIWNASRFVMLNLDGFLSGKPKKESLADRWIIQKLNIITKEVTSALEEYRFNDMASLLYQFWWHEFCDWYIEMAKDALAPKSDPQERQAAQERRSRSFAPGDSSAGRRARLSAAPGGPPLSGC